MYELHWEYMAGSIVVQAMLEEMNVRYDMSHVDMAADEHKTQAYRQINPLGRVPAITLPRGETIGETAAIVVALGEDAPGSGLTPQPGSLDRSAFLFWLNVMATAGYMTVARHGHPERYAFDEAAIAQVEQRAAQDLDTFFDLMDVSISGGSTFLESGFSALDLYLAMLTEWSDNQSALFAKRTNIAELYRAVSLRPSYQLAMQTHRL